MKTQDYIVNADGWVAGKLRAKGDTVQLTPGQAKYEHVTAKPSQDPSEAKGKKDSK